MAVTFLIVMTHSDFIIFSFNNPALNDEIEPRMDANRSALIRNPNKIRVYSRPFAVPMPALNRCYAFNMKQTTRLHGMFRSVIDWTIAPCEATPIASQDLLITGWKNPCALALLWRMTATGPRLSGQIIQFILFGVMHPAQTQAVAPPFAKFNPGS
jgi:hypothetical protein